MSSKKTSKNFTSEEKETIWREMEQLIQSGHSVRGAGNRLADRFNTSGEILRGMFRCFERNRGKCMANAFSVWTRNVFFVPFWMVLQ
jgi:hypothetical protein